MLPRWQGGVATAVVTALAVVLVVLDLTDHGVRRFWTTHAFTTDTVAGLLVVGLTVLVVDQVLMRRQLIERSRVIAAQAVILLVQARRSVKAALAVQDGSGDSATAADELRQYLLLLMVGAPVLIEVTVARRFLEQAQVLAAQVARVLAPSDVAGLTESVPTEGLDAAIERLRVAADPLLAILSSDERSVVADAAG